MSTYNGADYLQEQLQSLMAQSYANWILYWRDDSSSDSSVGIMSEFAAAVGDGRCVRVAEPEDRLRPTASFIAVLRAALPTMGAADCVAFADRDDVWLADKLARGMRALAATDSQVPALYCARLSVVDADLHRSSETRMSQRDCGFPASLTQNIATGCTVLLNRRVAALVAVSVVPEATLHDWWSYLLVSAAGGRILIDDAVVALYRQYGDNFVGIHSSQMRRAIAALRRGPSVFMDVLRQHVAALLAQLELICHANYAVLQQMQCALQGGLRQRLKVVRLPGLRRQTALETILFRIWFLLG